MPALGIVRIGHVALKVVNIERSLAFYRDKLGFAEMMRLHGEDGRLWLIYLRVTDTQYLELFPEGRGTRGPGPEVTSVHHFCLETEDMDRTVAALTEAGVALTSGPTLGADNNRQCWIEDPDGNRIEFMQTMPNALQLDAIRRLSAS